MRALASTTLSASVSIIPRSFARATMSGVSFLICGMFMPMASRRMSHSSITLLMRHASWSLVELVTLFGELKFTLPVFAAYAEWWWQCLGTMRPWRHGGNWSERKATVTQLKKFYENGTQTWSVIHRHHSHLLGGDVGHQASAWSLSSWKFENKYEIGDDD